MDRPETKETHTIGIVADTHGNRPYVLRGSRAKHTRLGNGSAAGLQALPDEVDHIVYGGDFLEKDKQKELFDASTTPAHGLHQRYNPRHLMESLLQRNPHTQHHVVIGNHEGKGVDDTESEIITMLHDLSAEYPNLSLSDHAILGNLLVCHGHQFIRRIRPHSSEELGQYEVIGMRDPDSIVHARDKHALAEAMCNVTFIQQFLEQQLEHIECGGIGEAHIYFSHTHQWFDETITYPPNAEENDPQLSVHVSNLGCLLPGRKTNYKKVTMEDNHVARVEALDLAKLGHSMAR